MPLRQIRPMLYTQQLKETVDFYTLNLGFTCPTFSEEWGWAALQKGDIELSISLPNAHAEFNKPTFTGSLYVICDDVDTFWAQIKHKVTVCYPIETFEYGMREFAIYDNNGYLLQFGQEVD